MEDQTIEQLRFYLCVNESKAGSVVYEEHQVLLNAFLHAQSETHYYTLHDILSRVSQRFNNGMSARAVKYWNKFLEYMNHKIHESFYNM